MDKNILVILIVVGVAIYLLIENSKVPIIEYEEEVEDISPIPLIPEIPLPVPVSIPLIPEIPLPAPISSIPFSKVMFKVNLDKEITPELVPHITDSSPQHDRLNNLYFLLGLKKLIEEKKPEEDIRKGKISTPLGNKEVPESSRWLLNDTKNGLKQKFIDLISKPFPEGLLSFVWNENPDSCIVNTDDYLYLNQKCPDNNRFVYDNSKSQIKPSNLNDKCISMEKDTSKAKLEPCSEYSDNRQLFGFNGERIFSKYDVLKCLDIDKKSQSDKGIPIVFKDCI